MVAKNASPVFVCRGLALLGYEKAQVSKDIAGMDIPGCGVDRWLKLNSTDAERTLRLATPWERHLYMTEYRIAWVTQMIELYQGKGD